MFFLKVCPETPEYQTGLKKTFTSGFRGRKPDDERFDVDFPDKGIFNLFCWPVANPFLTCFAFPDQRVTREAGKNFLLLTSCLCPGTGTKICCY